MGLEGVGDSLQESGNHRYLLWRQRLNHLTHLLEHGREFLVQFRVGGIADPDEGASAVRRIGLAGDVAALRQSLNGHSRGRWGDTESARDVTGAQRTLGQLFKKVQVGWADLHPSGGGGTCLGGDGHESPERLPQWSIFVADGWAPGLGLRLFDHGLFFLQKLNYYLYATIEGPDR
mgnify:CR=1 FL=1